MEKKGQIPYGKTEQILQKVREILNDQNYLLMSSNRQIVLQENQEEKQRLAKQDLEKEKVLQIQNSVNQMSQSQLSDQFMYFQKKQAYNNPPNKTSFFDKNFTSKQQDFNLKQQPQNDQNEQYLMINAAHRQQTKKLKKFASNNLKYCLVGIFESKNQVINTKTNKAKTIMNDVFVRTDEVQMLFGSVKCQFNMIQIKDVLVNKYI